LLLSNRIDLRHLKCAAFGDPQSPEYLDLKNYRVNPHRQAFGKIFGLQWYGVMLLTSGMFCHLAGWTSNNSVFATVGMDYRDACQRIRDNGTLEAATRQPDHAKHVCLFR